MTNVIQDQRDFLTSLTADQRISLTTKSNRPAAIRLVIIATAIALLATLITLKMPYWPVLLLPLGVLLIFLFTLMHEATHETVFATASVNRFVCHICGFLLLLPPAWFRYFHLAHHRHTQDAEKDPELQKAKPSTWKAYLIHVTGAHVWLSSIRALTGNALGQSLDSFIPVSASTAIRTEARLMLAGYLVCAMLSVWNNTYWLLQVWIVPMILGQPFLRLFLLAEHGGCALTRNMFENSRTTLTTGAIRFVSWNMPYHTEHHVYPSVPFHQLPALHALLKQHLRNTEDGYRQFTHRYIDSLR